MDIPIIVAIPRITESIDCDLLYCFNSGELSLGYFASATVQYIFDADPQIQICVPQKMIEKYLSKHR